MAEIAEKLRELAAEVERETRRLALPRERYTLAEALEAVRAVVPDESVAIDLSVWDHLFLDGYDIKWRVYDGRRNYEAGTLAGAVAACLAANAPADTLAQVQEAITTPDDGVITADFGASTHGEPATTVLG